jgi:hypothetical protein
LALFFPICQALYQYKCNLQFPIPQICPCNVPWILFELAEDIEITIAQCKFVEILQINPRFKG